MEPNHVDVLIVTALQDEMEAVLELGEGGKRGWREARDKEGFPFHQRELSTEDGRPFVVAVAWSGEMGETAAATRAKGLIDELSPSCLAMCGICAGKRGDVFLGDVIVADRVYSYDHGKLIERDDKGHEVAFFHDIETYNLDKAWKMHAAFLAREPGWRASLDKDRPRSKRSQEQWLLDALYAHEVEQGTSPLKHADRKARCPDWTRILAGLRQQELLARDPSSLALTDKGKKQVLADRLSHPDGLPEDPAFQVHVGTIATGNTVREDPGLFDRLKRLGRKTIGVEMEAAAIGYVGERLNRRAIIAKAVSDYGDHDKDDGFRAFACRASAAFLLAFLRRHVEPSERPIAPDPERLPWMRRDSKEEALATPGGDFLDRVERVCRHRAPEGTEIVRGPAPPPLSGILEVTFKEGQHLRMEPTAALFEPLDEAVLDASCALLEATYRKANPYVMCTLVHIGEAASEELVRKARARGVRLFSFAEYQGFIDFSRYNTWQAARLARDTLYPSDLYVEQRAELRVGRERSRTEDALATLRDLLRSPNPRFVLILGDFGTGKTFLMRELCRRTALEKQGTPVLVEMRTLEKRRSLKQLLAQHFAHADMDRINLDGFQYMLGEGQILLLFDGFDELAFRVSYARAVEHFETVLQAASGNAKVVVTSRTSHFLTDGDVNKALANRAEQVAGFRMLKLEPFDKDRIRRFLVKQLGSKADAERRLQLLDQVKDLLGLSANPRMLSLIAEVSDRELEEAKTHGGAITSASLYGMLLERWLKGEIDRAKQADAHPELDLDQLRRAVAALALLLWPRMDRGVGIDEIPAALLASVQALDPARPLDPDVAKHQIGSRSLLARDEEGRFSFIHQSVMEWLVAREAAEQVKREGDASCLAHREMSDLMADFFNALAGRDVARSWVASKRAGAEQEIAQKNALRVERRLRDTGKAEAEEEIVVEVSRSFEGLDLRGQDFSGADLVGANLQGANLSDATLVKANLTGADLRNAKLVHADLSAASLGKADLRGADLWQARLLGADLRAAILRGAKLRGAKLVQARIDSLEGCDPLGAALHAPKTIESVVGAAPSGCNTISFSPDGALLASGHSDGTVRLWDVATGQPLRVLEGHQGHVWSVAFAPDGQTLASASADVTVALWHVPSGQCLRVLLGHKAGVYSIAFAPDGQTLASASIDTTITLWHVPSGHALRILKGHKASVMSVAFAPDGQMLASASTDETVILWHVPSGQSLRVLGGYQGSVRSVAFAPDGQTLASASADATVTLWQVPSGQCLRVLRGHKASVWSVAFAPDGETLASASADTRVILWHVPFGKPLHMLKEHKAGVRSVAFAPNGQTLGSASDKDVTLWHLPSGQSLRVPEGRRISVTSVAFAPDGETLGSASDDKDLILWHVPSGQPLRMLDGDKSGIVNFAFAPDGQTLASTSAHKTVTLWSVHSGQPLRVLEGHKASVRSVAFAPDGQTLASASDDKTVILWHVPSGEPLRVLEGHKDSIRSVAFAPDGQMLASVSEDRAVILWHMSSSQSSMLQGHKASVWSIAFAPNGQTLASASADGTLILWNVSSGRALRVIEGHQGPVTSVVFAPDGQTLASASADKTVMLWNVRSGQILRVLEGHKNRVRSVAFAPDGRTLASASADGTVRLWEVATGAHLATLLKLPEGWVAFTPDGRYKLGGDTAGAFWHVIGLCRFEPGELDPYLDRSLRIPDEDPLLPPAPTAAH